MPIAEPEYRGASWWPDRHAWPDHGLAIEPTGHRDRRCHLRYVLHRRRSPRDACDERLSPGTALIMFTVGVPVLLLSMALTPRFGFRAIVVWTGTLSYIAYNGVLLLFATPFNALFLLYVAMFGLCPWSIGSLLGTANLRGVAARASERFAARRVAAYMLIIAVLNVALWLQTVMPGVLSSSPPSFLDGTGLPTNPAYVQDLAWW